MRISCSQAIKCSLAGFAALVVIYSCDLNPMQSQLPGNQWILSDTSFSISVTPYTRATSFGASSSLYMGSNGAVSAGTLLKFDFQDSTILENITNVELYIFPKDSNHVLGNFYLHLMPASETWTGSDTGLTFAQYADLLPEYDGTATMVKDSVAVYGSGSALVMEDTLYVKFNIETTTIDNWRTDPVTNNGFLITTDEPSMLSFFSTENVRDPYLLIKSTFADPSDTNLYTDHLRPADDTYVIDDIGTPKSESLPLNFSQGKSLHIGFSDQFIPAAERPLAGGRLILFRDVNSPIDIENVAIYILTRKYEFPANIDTSLIVADTRTITIATSADSLVINLTSFLYAVAVDSLYDVAGGKEIFGFDLLVNPVNNDFDQLEFYGSTARELRPRLEILYATPYTEEGL